MPEVAEECEVGSSSNTCGRERGQEQESDEEKSGGGQVLVTEGKFQAAATQTRISHPPSSFCNFGVESLSQEPGAIQYYTSFSDYEHFKYVFGCLGPAAFELKYKSQKLSPEDEFLLLLMKLRLNKDDKELAYFFRISPPTVGKVFKTWLNFVYFQLRELNIWPTRAVIDCFMPDDFRAKFPNTRTILDGTEIPIEKPSKPEDQSATWSSYKNRNTLKVVVGITPRGDVNYVSEVYGGAASDRQIVERSDLLKGNNLFTKNDSIMADRGFIVQDLFCLKQVHVNVPTVMRGMSQLPPENVVRDRHLAAKRVHVERVIGLAKTFRILKDELDHSYIPLGGRILYTCFALTNLRPSIMHSQA